MIIYMMIGQWMMEFDCKVRDIIIHVKDHGHDLIMYQEQCRMSGF